MPTCEAVDGGGVRCWQPRSRSGCRPLAAPPPEHEHEAWFVEPGPQALGNGEDKAEGCHCDPPGSENCQTIVVSAAAAETHFDHADMPGACDNGGGGYVGAGGSGDDVFDPGCMSDSQCRAGTSCCIRGSLSANDFSDAKNWHHN